MERYGHLDQRLRSAQKAQARRADSEDLRSGRIGTLDLVRRNGFFSALDIESGRILAVGAREVADRRSRTR